jgi:ubiquinone/menaquinone biosynthesis C-methylase UbiE
MIIAKSVALIERSKFKRVLKIFNIIRVRINPKAYWTGHLVEVDKFKSAEESLGHFHWRNSQYPAYIELMPVNTGDNLVVLDFGCGPGNDLVGFSQFSKPAELYGIDVSPKAIDLARERLALHGSNVSFQNCDEKFTRIDLPDDSVDLIHSSGVLHHMTNPDLALQEFYRILKPGGKVQIMVYNRNSLWFHLKTAYQTQILENKFGNLTTLEAFEKTTDGEFCPIARCYKPEEFLAIVEKIGFKGWHKGNSFSLIEAAILPLIPQALMDKRLSEEHRNFLEGLTYNEKNFPVHAGHVAGINSCFEFTKQ